MKSVASTDMLKSEAVTPFITPGADDNDSMYKQYPFPPPGPRGNLPMDNPSTDELLPTHSRAEDYNTPRRPSQPLPQHYALRRAEEQDAEPVASSPLLDHSQAQDQADYVVPYPPTAYNQPPPHGYTPPGMRRQNTGYSDGSDIGAAPSYRTGHGGGHDNGAAPSYATGYGGGQVSYGGYDDPYEPYEPRRQGSRDDLGGYGRR